MYIYICGLIGSIQKMFFMKNLGIELSMILVVLRVQNYPLFSRIELLLDVSIGGV